MRTLPAAEAWNATLSIHLLKPAVPIITPDDMFGSFFEDFGWGTVQKCDHQRPGRPYADERLPWNALLSATA